MSKTIRRTRSDKKPGNRTSRFEDSSYDQRRKAALKRRATRRDSLTGMYFC